MSTWQIFPDAGSSFRWEVTEYQQLSNETTPSPPSDSFPLPSFSDLLLQGYTKSNEKRGDDSMTCPIIQSGLRKPMTVKKSSITKAISILRDDGNTIADRGCSDLIKNHQGSFQSPPMFQSGSGESMKVKQSSIMKALSILGDEGEATPDNPGHLSNGSDRGCTFPNSVFQTGSGKKVNISSAGLVKAKTLLGLEGDNDCDNIFGPERSKNQPNEPFGWPNWVSETKERANVSSHEDATTPPIPKSKVNYTSLQSGVKGESTANLINSGSTFPNSVFQTGSGKKVNISSAGLVKAKTLLGLEGDYDCDNIFGAERSKNQPNKPFGWPNSVSETEEKANVLSHEDATTPPIPKPKVNYTSFQSGVKGESTTNLINSDSKCPPIKFQSASGRSISVSKDALQRAKSLLCDLEHGSLSGEEDANCPSFSIIKQGEKLDNYSNKKNSSCSTITHQKIDRSKCMVEGVVSLPRSVSNQHKSSVMSEKLNLRNNLIDRFDAEDQNSTDKVSNSYIQQKMPSIRPFPHTQINTHFKNTVQSRTSRGESYFGMPLGDISNTHGMADKDDKLNGGLKRRPGKSFVSPFKKPRNSTFITPIKNVVPALNGNFVQAFVSWFFALFDVSSFVVKLGRSFLANEESFSRKRISTQYPFEGQRKYVEEYFSMSALPTRTMKSLPDHVRRMSPKNAVNYLFPDASGVECIGPEAFYHMLIQSGASAQYSSKKWVSNHYKWIVWKLACYERHCPCKASGKLFTVNNVLQELKLRYEREVNHGHRSAIKRILEGDQPPSLELVLCISSIHHDATPTTTPMPSNNVKQTTAAMVEVTDGWYSVNAFLDVHLSKKLAAGKIFVGQKLRIWGAGLCGWEGPISPLEESSMVGLSLHINGTYRAHWATRLGLCKTGSVPLAFRCIKGMGGPVPCTLVGVTRIYPVQYRERLSNGGFVMRSDRMEAKIVQLHSQRRSAVAEGIMSEFQTDIKTFDSKNDTDSEEGAKILNILETSAEPELIMAGMSREQLSAFSSYKAKLEETRKSDMQKSIETAWEAAGLWARDVTPFMRVRVVGLTTVNSPTNCNIRKGIITIWNPSIKQVNAVNIISSESYGLFVEFSASI